MRTDILEYLQNEVYNRCKLPSNKFGMGCYHHIEAVVRNCVLIADQYRADKEVVLIASWLHDIASVTDYALYEEHHIHGAEIAAHLLTNLEYDPKKIPLIQDCIRNHRGSVTAEKNTVEELCVADADAISHFDSIPSLLYLAYVQRQMDMDEGVRFVRDKLDRSFAKLSDAGKKLYSTKYEQIMQVLSGK